MLKPTATARIQSLAALKPWLPWLGLLAVFAGTLLLSIPYARSVLSYHLMSDELAWSRLALGVVEDGYPNIRGQLPNLAVLYAFLTSPAYLFDSMQEALTWARTLGAVYMASTVLPVYLLTRRLVAEPWVPVLVAALSVAVPWLVFSGMLMSETVAYPTFCWALLACHWAIIRPGVRGDLLALATIGVAFLARPQLAVLLGALVLAVLAYELATRMPGWRAGPRLLARSAREGLAASVRLHPLLAVVALAGGLVAALGATTQVFGSYGVVFEGGFLPEGTTATGLALLANVGVALGLLPVPLAIAWALARLVRGERDGRTAYAALLVFVVPLLVVQVASFVLQLGIGGLQDRYLLYLAPPLLIGMALWFLDARRSWVLTLGAAGAYAWTLGQVPWRFVGHPDPSLNIAITPAVGFHRVIDGQTQTLLGFLGIDGVPTITVMRIGLIVVPCLLLLIGATSLRRRTAFAVVGIALLGFGTAQANYLLDRAEGDQYGGIFAELPYPRGISGGPEGHWIDPAIPSDARVALIPWRIRGVGSIQDPWWDSELRNRTVEMSLQWGEEPRPTVFRGAGATMDSETGKLELGYPATHVVLSVEFPVYPRGEVAARSPNGYLRLVALVEPAWAEAMLRSASPDNRTLPDADTALRIFAPESASGEGVHRRVRLSYELPVVGTPGDAPRQLLLAGEREPRSIAPGEAAEAIFETCVPGGGHVDLPLSTRGPDGEEQLGMRIAYVTAETLPGQCRPGDHRAP